jgi:hypothetical protein
MGMFGGVFSYIYFFLCIIDIMHYYVLSSLYIFNLSNRAWKKSVLKR